MAKAKYTSLMAEQVQNVLQGFYTDDMWREDGEKKADALARHIIDALNDTHPTKFYGVIEDTDAY